MKNQVKFYSILIFVAHLFSCANAPQFSAGRFGSGETKGTGKRSLDLVLDQTDKINISDNLLANPIDQSTGSVKRALSFGVLYASSIINSLDFEFDWLQNAPLMFGLKYQFFGSPESGSGAGNISFAIKASTGFALNFGNLQGPGEEDGPARETKKTIDMGIVATSYEAILSYKIFASGLVSYGYTFQKYGVGGTIVGTATDKIDIRGQQLGHHLNYHHHFGYLVLKTHLSYSKNESNQYEDLAEYYFGLGVGVKF